MRVACDGVHVSSRKRGVLDLKSSECIGRASEAYVKLLCIIRGTPQGSHRSAIVVSYFGKATARGPTLSTAPQQHSKRRNAADLPGTFVPILIREPRTPSPQTENPPGPRRQGCARVGGSWAPRL